MGVLLLLLLWPFAPVLNRLMRPRLPLLLRPATLMPMLLLLVVVVVLLLL
jgi:hypothetical protein